MGMKLTVKQLQQIIKEEMAAGRMAPSLTVTKLARVNKSFEVVVSEMAKIHSEDGFRMLDPDLQNRARSAYTALSDMRTTLNELTEAMNAEVRRPVVPTSQQPENLSPAVRRRPRAM